MLTGDSQTDSFDTNSRRAFFGTKGKRQRRELLAEFVYDGSTRPRSFFSMVIVLRCGDDERYG